MKRGKLRSGFLGNMEIRTIRTYDEKADKLCKRNKVLQRVIDKKLRFLVLFPKHPSLRLHKIDSKRDAWSMSVNMKTRILFVYREYGILLVDIGSHDQVY